MSPIAPLLAWALAVPALAQAPPTAAAEAQEEALPPLVKEPALITFVEASYPEAARTEGREGSVILLIEITETGAVQHVEVLESAGEDLDEAAVQAAQQLVWSPAEDAEGPVPVAIEFEYGFVLDVAAKDGATPIPDAPSAPEAAPAPVNLEGTLQEMGTKRPLGGVIVQATPRGAPDQVFEATTDDTGRFEFRGVPVGMTDLAARFPGFRPYQAKVEITEGEVADITLWLRNTAYRDNEIVGVYQRQREPEVTRRTISVEEIRRIPGTFGDPVRVVQNLPGAARAAFGSGALIIRGSNPEDTGVFVDGISVPLIYHLGGFVSVINADLIESVDYMPGGFGVKYGRLMGGVVDVKTKEQWPEAPRLNWSTDALDSGGLFQMRVGQNKKTGIAIAARRSYIDLFLGPLTGETGFTVKPYWYDYQVKISALDRGKEKLSGFVFGYEDKLILASPDDFAQGTDTNTQGDLGVRYDTHRAVFRWEKPINEQWAIRLNPSAGLDTIEFNLGDAFNFTQRTYLAYGRLDAPYEPNEHFRLTPGIDFGAGWYDVDIAFPFSPEQFTSFDPLAEDEPYSIFFDGFAYTLDPYAQVELRPLKDPEALLIQPGLRLNTWHLRNYNATSVDPRLQLRARLIEGGSVKAGGGLYHQPPQGPDLGLDQDDVQVDYERTVSVEVGWEQFIGEAFQADLTLFAKRQSELLVEVTEDSEAGPNQFIENAGIGRVDGMEVMLRHALVDKFFGWVSYTLSHAQRKDHPDQGDDWYDYQYDQTHILTLVAGYRLPREWEISGRVRYVTGNPYTPYEGGVYDIDQDSYMGYQTGQWNELRQPDFFAVDARVDRLFTFKRWQLEVYADFLNVIRGQNPEDVQYNYDYTEHAWVQGLPFIPSPGFEAEINF